MEVLLQKDVDRLGKAFDVVKVRDGFAINFLFPQRLAVRASEAKKRRIEQDKKAYERKEAARLTEAQAAAQKLAGQSVTITVKVDEDEHLYGSVTAAMVAEKLNRDGVKVDKRDVLLPIAIKAVGVYTVPVRVHSQLKVDVQVWVVKEGGEAGEAQKAPAPSAKK